MSTLTGLLGGAGKPIKVTQYTSGSGSHTPVSTSNGWFRVTLVSGGSGGFGASQSSFYGGPGNILIQQASGGSGGTNGQAVTYWLKSIEPSYSYTVGAGGTGGTGAWQGGVPGNGPAPGTQPTTGSETLFGPLGIGIANGAPTVTFNTAAPGTLSQGILPDKAWLGGVRGSGAGFTPSVVASIQPLKPGFTQAPSPSLYSGIPPWAYLTNNGTVSPATPGHPLGGLEGGGGGPTVFSNGGTGGSTQSPFNAATISGGNAPGYGGGGGGGALIGSPSYTQATNTFTVGNGGNGSGGLIIVEEFVF